MTESGIAYFNRYSKTVENEKVYGGKFVNWLYQAPLGQEISRILSKPPLSIAYGVYQDSALSRHKVFKFVEDFDIPLSDFLPAEGRDKESPYANFNQFFIRKFKDGKRVFTKEKREMPAFAEGRYLGWNQVSPEQVFPVKGSFLSANSLIESESTAKKFEGGPLLICRLCPVDYHRFHFPDDGEYLSFNRLAGAYHSVNPVALAYKGDIFCTNERHVSILKTAEFGELAYIEVGAMCVGKIIQSHSTKTRFSRGEEKGYFLFGGSTVILLGQPGAWKVSEDIILNTDNRLETFVKLGDAIAQK